MTYAQGPNTGGSSGATLNIFADQRTGLTAADSGTTTLFSPTSTGHLLLITITVICTTYVSGAPLYTLSWTEAGVSFTKSASVSATGPFTYTLAIQPDNATNVTVELTGTFSATVDVAGLAIQIV
jgi:hypothetical protein